MVGGVAGIYRQEFDFLLDHLAPVGNKVTYLGVSVFDSTTHLGQVFEGFGAHVGELREGGGFVVTALLFYRE